MTEQDIAWARNRKFGQDEPRSFPPIGHYSRKLLFSPTPKLNKTADREYSYWSKELFRPIKPALIYHSSRFG
jgi:hypothetical protein